MGLQAANDYEKYMVELINTEREAAGLAPLKVEFHLNDSAQEHTNWMASTGTMSHTGEGGSSASQRIRDADFPLEGSWATRENLGYVSVVGGLGNDEIQNLHRNLMASESHRDNILDPAVAYVGIGLTRGTITQNGQDFDVLFVTQNFADTDGEVLVQEEIGGQDVAVPYQDGEPTGEPQPIQDVPDMDEEPNVPVVEPGEDPDDPDNPDTPDDDDNGSSGSCFVATAAYGDRAHPDVVALRRFRDEVLVNSVAGRAFIRTYWKFGPVLARGVKSRGVTGHLTRAALSPLARRARSCVSQIQ